MKYRISVRLLLLLLFAPPLFAVSLADMKDGSLLLGPYVRIFEDKAGTATWADVLAGKHETDFKTQDKAVPNFGSTRSVIWAVVDISFDGGQRPTSNEYLLELSHPVPDYVDLVVVDARTGEVLQKWETGDLRPFDSRPINHRSFLFPLGSLTPQSPPPGGRGEA